MKKEALIACFQNTVDISNQLLKEETVKSASSNRVYKEGFVAKKQKKNYKADIIVESNTSFNAAKKYLQYGKTAVLNFANPHNPGGGVQNGAMAQEECLCRSSNLYPCISNDNVSDDYYLYNKNTGYYFFSDRLIYTKDVTVFKDDSDVPQIMPENEWFNVDVITCAAPYIAERKHTNKAALKELFKSRIKNIFESAIDNGVEVIILGAFGCGAFKNPPEVVAKAFHEVIDENGYAEQFKKIVFAIKSTVNDDLYMPCPNIMAFEQEFFIISAEANKLRLSDPYPFEQAIGEIKMPSGRILKGGEQFNPYIEWKSKNKYSGKQFSILGDSVSTLEGYNPRGYNLFYYGEKSEESGVEEMKDTWWGKVIDFFGGELLVNNSWSGSRVTRLPNNDKLFPSGCSDERTSSLHINSVKPDVIIIYLGINDWAFGAELDGTRLLIDKLNMQYFGAAYKTMLEKIKTNYPEAEIWCCTLNTTFMSFYPSFKFPYERAGNHIEEYNQIIRDIANTHECKVIDLYDYHLPYDSIDGSHPDANGMNTLAMLMIREIGGQEIEQFIDCENEQHKYSLQKYNYDQNYNGGYHVCEKCGKRKYGQDGQNEEMSNANEKHTKCDAQYKYADMDISITRCLFDNKLKLFVESKAKDVIFNQNVVSIGRDSSCDINLDYPEISKQHARFYYESSIWFIADTNSTNGILLNGKKIEPNTKYELFSGDVIDIANREKLVFYKSELVAEQSVKEMTVSVGTVIDGKYELIKQIGHGGFTETYLAMGIILNKALAAKICTKSNSSEEITEAIINEARMVKHLNHPAIPHIVDIIDNDEYLCIIEDYIEGITLEEIVKKYGAQPKEKVIDWAKQLCDVLGYLHSHYPPYIHRDVKPANIILKPNGNIVLIDFGIMRTYKPKNIADTQNFGTKGYAAPEQYGGRGQTDARTDIYGLGMTLYHLITGIDPKGQDFVYKPISQINPNLPKGLECVIDKCVQLDPDKRYQNTQEVYSAFESLSDCVYTSPDIMGSKLKQGIKSLFKKRKNDTDSNYKVNETDSQPPEMNIVQCKNGHFYDATEFSKCPHCEQYPLNKQKDIEGVPCVYAPPDIMSKKHKIRRDNEK